MTDVALDFNVGIFCDGLHSTKPPFRCPVDTCQRIYRSHAGIQFHLLNFDHVGETLSHPLTPPLSLRTDCSSSSGASNEDIADDNLSRCFDTDEKVVKRIVPVRTPKKSPRKIKVKTISSCKSNVSTPFKSDLSFKDESSVLDESIQVIDVYDSCGTVNGVSKLNICDRIEVFNCDSELLDDDPINADKSVVIGGNGLVVNCGNAVVSKSKSKKLVALSREISLTLPTAVFKVAASDNNRITPSEINFAAGQLKCVNETALVARNELREERNGGAIEPLKSWLPDGDYIKFEEKSLQEMEDDIEYDLDEEVSK